MTALEARPDEILDGSDAPGPAADVHDTDSGTDTHTDAFTNTDSNTDLYSAYGACARAGEMTISV